MLGIYLDDVIGLRMEDEWNEFSAGFTEAGCRAGTEIRRRMNKSIESFPNFERIVLSGGESRGSASCGSGTARRSSSAAGLRRRMNTELNFPHFEGLVLGCIDADFCK